MGLGKTTLGPPDVCSKGLTNLAYKHYAAILHLQESICILAILYAPQACQSQLGHNPLL